MYSTRGVKRFIHFRLVVLNLGFAVESPEELLKSPDAQAAPKTQSSQNLWGWGPGISIFLKSSWSVSTAVTAAPKAVMTEAVHVLSTRWHQKPFRCHQQSPKAQALC